MNLDQSLYGIKSFSSVDLITPVILFELNKLMDAGVRVDLLESSLLLNETQALHLTLLMQDNDQYYLRIEDTIRKALARYNIEWILDASSMRTYCLKYLASMGFEILSDKECVSSKSEIPCTSYDMVLLRALLEKRDWTSYLANSIIDETTTDETTIDVDGAYRYRVVSEAGATLMCTRSRATATAYANAYSGKASVVPASDGAGLKHINTQGKKL